MIFSSAMAQYLSDLPDLRAVVDFVDVDSAKWNQYAQSRHWPLSAIFKREGARLLAFDRAVANAAAASVFVTSAEAQLFRTLAPECATRVHYAQNGVDTEYFSPLHELPNPFRLDEDAIVFTGAMDYWPNIDAVNWFAQEAFPEIVARHPRARFYIVGIQPAPVVQALARDARVVVTGARARRAAVSATRSCRCCAFARCARHPEQGTRGDGQWRVRWSFRPQPPAPCPVCRGSISKWRKMCRILSATHSH